MPETANVSEYFPKAPERCYECPALVAAACRLQKEAMEAGNGGAEPIDDTAALAVGGLEQAMGVALSVAALPHGAVRSVGAVVSVVHWHCPDGPIVSRQIKSPRFLPWLFGRRRSRLIVTRQCGSLSPASYIVPEVSEEGPIVAHER